MPRLSHSQGFINTFLFQFIEPHLAGLKYFFKDAENPELTLKTMYPESFQNWPEHVLHCRTPDPLFSSYIKFMSCILFDSSTGNDLAALK